MLCQRSNSVDQYLGSLSEQMFPFEFAGRFTAPRLIPGKDRIAVSKEDLDQGTKHDGTVPTGVAASMHQDDGRMEITFLRRPQLSHHSKASGSKSYFINYCHLLAKPLFTLGLDCDAAAAGALHDRQEGQKHNFPFHPLRSIST
jgi:hypothetical protein